MLGGRVTLDRAFLKRKCDSGNNRQFLPSLGRFRGYAAGLPSGSGQALIPSNKIMSQSSAHQNGKTTDKRPLVFAVDDEPMLLELAVMVVEPLGCRVMTFRDPVEAVRVFSLANPLPDLIITDFAMHQMNGLDLIRECRRINPGQKILMVSGTVDETVYKDSPHKPDVFLAKPYQTAVMAQIVNELLGRD